MSSGTRWPVSRLAPVHSHSSCMRRQEEILSPRDWMWHPLLWLPVQCSSHRNPGCRPGSTQRRAGVCSLTACKTQPGKNSIVHGLWAAEEDEISEEKQLKKVPKRYEEQRKTSRSEGTVPQDLSGCIEREGQGLSPISGRARHSKANRSFLLLRMSNEIVYRLPPSQTKQITKSRKTQKGYMLIWAQSQVYNWCTVLKNMIALFFFFKAWLLPWQFYIKCLIFESVFTLLKEIIMLRKRSIGIISYVTVNTILMSVCN